MGGPIAASSGSILTGKSFMLMGIIGNVLWHDFRVIPGAIRETTLPFPRFASAPRGMAEAGTAVARLRRDLQGAFDAKVRFHAGRCWSRCWPGIKAFTTTGLSLRSASIRCQLNWQHLGTPGANRGDNRPAAGRHKWGWA